MKKLFGIVTTAALCLACLPVMPLNAAAQATITEEDVEVDGLVEGQKILRHYVYLDTDLFSYECRADYFNYNNPSLGLVQGYDSIITTDVTDATHMVTNVAYDENGKPFAYFLNYFGQDDYGGVDGVVYQKFVDEALGEGTTLEIGDLVDVGKWACWSDYEIRYLSDNPVTLKKCGNCIDVLGEDFKQVLYYMIRNADTYFMKEFNERNLNFMDVDAVTEVLAEKGMDDYLYNKGYIDDNASLNILDVILVNRSILGKATLTPYQQKCADVDRDGMVTPSDSLLMMKHIVGIIDSFD